MTNNLFVRLMTFSRVVSLFYIIKNYLTHEENISLVVTGMPNLCGYGSAHQHPDGKESLHNSQGQERYHGNGQRCHGCHLLQLSPALLKLLQVFVNTLASVKED